MFQRAFSVSTREPAALLFAPGGHSPTGVFAAWCNVGTFVRLCFGVSCGIARARSFVCAIACVTWPCMIVAVPWLWPSCMAVHGRRVCGRGVVSVCVWWSCRGVLAVSVVSHVCGGVVAVTWRCAWCDCVALCRGCDTPMNASVSNDFHGVSISRFAQSIGCVYSESHQANDNERNRDGREATTTETTTARMVTRSPP